MLFVQSDVETSLMLVILLTMINTVNVNYLIPGTNLPFLANSYAMASHIRSAPYLIDPPNVFALTTAFGIAP